MASSDCAILQLTLTAFSDEFLCCLLMDVTGRCYYCTQINFQLKMADCAATILFIIQFSDRAV